MLAIAAAAVILVLAIPLLSVRLGSSDAGNDPASSTTARPTTCSPRASGRASTARWTWSPRPVAQLMRPRLKTLENQLPHVADVTKVTHLASAHGIEVKSR